MTVRKSRSRTQKILITDQMAAIRQAVDLTANQSPRDLDQTQEPQQVKLLLMVPSSSLSKVFPSTLTIIVSELTSSSLEN